MKNKSVLVTGIGQANYILQLYGNIAPKLKEFSFNSINLRKFGDSNVENNAKKIFEENYRYKFSFRNIFQTLKACFTIINTKYFWKDHRISLAEHGWKYIKSGYYLTKNHISSYHYAQFIDKETETDIIHLHFPTHLHALFLKYLQKDYEIIVTYWGSDIYRITTWKDHEIQNSSLNDVKIITVATPEMQFALLTRFGFELKPKIRNARFIHNNAFYERADLFMQDKEWVSGFKNELKISPNKIIILFGHNAFEQNNHVHFLKCLKSLPNHVLKKFHIIFPFAYGDKSGKYEEKLRNITKTIDCEFTYLTKFLGWRELAKLKVMSDVYIHGPTTDGLSAFLTEYFYTNNLAIVGDWLPYKTFSNLGLAYIPFRNFQDLSNVLMELEEKLLTMHEFTRENHKIVSENFSINRISEEWVSIFKEIS